MADINELFEGFEEPMAFEPEDAPAPVVVESSPVKEKEEK